MRQKVNGTFLDPEEYCYPSGSLRQSSRRFAARCPDGIIRKGICGLADTFFSIPARLNAKGKTVTGFVGSDENGFFFLPFTYGKNGNIFNERIET